MLSGSWLSESVCCMLPDWWRHWGYNWLPGSERTFQRACSLPEEKMSCNSFAYFKCRLNKVSLWNFVPRFCVTVSCYFCLCFSCLKSRDRADTCMSLAVDDCSQVLMWLSLTLVRQSSMKRWHVPSCWLTVGLSQHSSPLTANQSSSQVYLYLAIDVL